MTTRVLARIAVVLAVLLGGSTWLALDRLGLLRTPAPLEWSFENPFLDVAYGTRVVLRPAVAGQPGVRYWFGPKVTAPEAVMGVDPAEAFRPHIRAGVEQQSAEDHSWSYSGISFLLLSQLGALTTKEWLEELGPVMERGPGGRERLLLRAVFGHESGAKVEYFFDPADKRRLERGFGWERSEMRAPDRPPDVSFTEPAGLLDPSK